MREIAHVMLTPQGINLTDQYRALGDNYPKFHKMDKLSKLGYLASEKLLSSLEEERFVDRTDRAIVLCSKRGCLDCDREYLATINDAEGYFPSPSLFVYSLPNIVAGEIAIRNHYQGETSFYLLAEYQPETIHRLVEETFLDLETKTVLCGWLDYQDDEHYLADFYLYENK